MKKKIAISILSLALLVIPVKATDYSLQQTRNVSTSAGTATAYCTGTYHSSGNTRWNTSWSAYGANLKQAVVSSTMQIPSDSYMTTTGKITMTNYSYVVASTSTTFAFRYSGDRVVAA